MRRGSSQGEILVGCHAIQRVESNAEHQGDANGDTRDQYHHEHLLHQR